MPSPVGHALAGVAAAWLAGGRLPRGWHGTLFLPGLTRTTPVSVDFTRHPWEMALFGAAAIAPDLDLLVGTHSTYTHSIGAVIFVFIVTLFATGTRRWRIAIGIAAAWGSHLLLDWLGSDTSPPIGIMALWPFDGGYYQSSRSVFDAISRRYWMPQQFIVGNVKATIKEVIVLAPIFAAAFALRRRS